ncbi:Bacteriophytochrome (light-regulated signal transduction histidine kinase) [Epilithonimonas bovis DSM 19482]|uniref:histidine kinase n=1 Tax=Epilithonimonas bovis DSM 19482 TaxID=1121284 RepID=A0A1U7PZA0_9FLAO|nr:ATP-binding protein [Epilithonimonas bovis]SIT98097.1 Bacteriophytochrome (light-regulated signal transduction histidine kinase) [Epilithonimonas bovis DSM 19482]
MYPKEYINCDQEAIHICGEVQEYGFLIGVQDSKITFYSQNILDLFPVNNILGEDIHAFFDQLGIDINWENYSDNQELAIQHISYNNQEYTVSIHTQNGFTFFEIEIVFPGHKINKEYFAVQSILRNMDSKDIWKLLLKEIQAIIDFDRVMIYQFLYDGSGQVIEELVKPNLESYLDLHYPESDIPAQARAMYLKNPVRITSHVSGTTSPIVGIIPKENIDLTYSVTRASSPVHRQYLKNAHVESSFSTSIIVNGELWGLVACQNAAPKHLDLQSRLLAETLTRASANAYASQKSLKTLKEYQKINLNNISLRQNLLSEEDFGKSLKKNIRDIMDSCAADGMIIRINNEILTCGKFPNDNDIEKIIDWSKQHNSDFEENTFASNSFCQTKDLDLDTPDKSCGIIISILGNNTSDMLIWLRKEQGHKIKWAGKPEKSAISEIRNGVEIIKFSPRKSFEVWKEYVKGTSLPWKIKEIESAKWITSVILKASHTKSSQILDLNNQLKELNQELDSFSHSISHDLNTPLTVIKLNAQLAKRLPDPEKVQTTLDNIIAQVDTMSDMIRNVLELSRIKKSEIELKKIEVDSLIEKLAEDSKISFNCPKTEIIIENTPEVLGDKTMVYQVFINVIGNAVKYSSKSKKPLVKIVGKVYDDAVTYSITDNGIGIDQKESKKMFKIFSRMNNAKEFKGNGVGLSIVHHLMEKMGGKISYENESGKGTTFILKFQKPNYDFSIS